MGSKTNLSAPLFVFCVNINHFLLDINLILNILYVK